MDTLYGKYPKRIICQCNAEEMDTETVTIALNDRCPICHSLRQICIPKLQEMMKAGFGMADVQKAEELVLTTHKELTPLMIWGEVLNDHFDRSFSYFSYFMTLSGMFWSYAWAFLALSPEKLQRKS